MSKKDENINKYIKKSNRNITNNISDDLDFSNEENSKENNSYQKKIIHTQFQAKI